MHEYKIWIPEIIEPLTQILQLDTTNGKNE